MAWPGQSRAREMRTNASTIEGG
ncbi:hypothetical protein CCACVL1_26155 [Corchorus capsularis]|uniref:Uncharacterized protein n=1 Tax=Corchorus capsularis TaxID=210143 RepID=A0A1R3GFV5_COCAP|nr:hypothetical protein CCACVL1_26155 [Corchorus capsularis]